MKISGLIFSADSIPVTEDAARHLKKLCDEVVVIYCTSYHEFLKLKRSAPDWMRVFYVLRLGYAEPYRKYGMYKCRGDWIILLDTDERFNNLGKIRELIENSRRGRADGAQVREPGLDFSTKQYRIFRKGSLSWKGNIHDHPAGRGARSSTSRRRGLRCCTTRASARAKGLPEAQRDPALPASHRTSPLWMRLSHGRLTGQISSRSSRTDMRFIPQPSRKNRETCDAIKKIGVTRMLGLDRPSVVEALNRKYRSKRQGVELLARLLKVAVPSRQV